MVHRRTSARVSGRSSSACRRPRGPRTSTGVQAFVHGQREAYEGRPSGAVPTSGDSTAHRCRCPATGRG
ncbi:hypothetical protein QJS66_09175 [Kocuria rhizophila]|nr:hypothetical protein QJS66_09175 [Kocuria rhizophila]